MVNLIGNFSKLDSKKILVAGDLLLDTYTIGKARRISPEAPVAVIEVESSEEKAGGAGNTILNLISLGAQIIALGRVGDDPSGKTLLKTLENENVDISGIITEKGFKTPVKNRIVADGQQIVRVDHEEISPTKEEDALIKALPNLLKGVEAVAISDYGKGLLTPRLLKELIAQAKALDIFIIADPKGNDFTRYLGVNLIKPNLKEALLAAPKARSLDEAAKYIFEKTNADYLMVTRSEDGISLYDKSGSLNNFPVAVKQVKDVTGAGDTVLAMLTLAIANKLPLPIAIQFSNVAAGIAIEQFGCARVTLPELAKRLLEIDPSNKVFDEDHLHALQAALSNHSCSYITVPKTLSNEFVNTLLRHKKQTGHALIALIQTENNTPAIETLAALQPIDFILLNSSSEALKKAFKGITCLS